MLLYPRHTLPTAIAPVLVAGGLAWRHGVLAPGPALLALLAGWLVQIGGVFTDNYANLVRHPDDAEHALFVAALRRGVISLGVLRLAIAAVYGAALLCGLALVAVGGLPVLTIGLTAIVGSLLYSVGPFPLGDRALGDPLFFATFGPLAVAGAYYVQAAAVLGAAPGWWPPATHLPAGAWIASLPVGALITLILLIDNIRDREFDLAKHEYTITVLIGRRWSLVEYGALLALAYVTPPAMWIWGGFGAGVLLPLLSLPYALLVFRRVIRAPGHDALIPMTPQAGQALLAYCVLFTAGLAG